MAAPLLPIGASLVGAGILGSFLKNYSDEKRTNKQANIMKQALANVSPILEQSYNQAYDIQKPFLYSGIDSFNQYLNEIKSFNPENYVSPDVGDFTYNKSVEDFLAPASKYEQQQAMDQILGNAAVSGLVKSGGTLKALQDRAQDIAAQRYEQARQAMYQDKSQLYRQYLDRAQQLQQLAQQKLQATQAKLGGLANISSIGASSAGNLGQLITDKAQTKANMMLGTANLMAQNTPIGILGHFGNATQQLLPLGSYILGNYVS